MAGLLEPEEKVNSLAKHRFAIHSKFQTLELSRAVTSNRGKLIATQRIRLIRDGVILRDNCQVESLKHFKDDAKKVGTGLECGIKIAGFDDVKKGDVFEVYEIVKVQRTI
jgi:translation initiation factor IF-2